MTNNLKVKGTASSWTLQYVLKVFKEDDYNYNCGQPNIAFDRTSHKCLARGGSQSSYKKVECKVQWKMTCLMLYYI